MNLNCLNTIITDNLAIHIDITQLKSWNLNTGLTLVSLTKWNDAISSDLELFDFGLTAFDNGRTNDMINSLTLTQNDNKLNLYRVGYNNESGGTYYSGYTITPITGSSVGYYFSLDGGYLQGFFKLEDYDYQLLPPRYNKGITIETIIEILPQTEGIFYHMGTRSEDKYNLFFSGECGIVETNRVKIVGNETGYQYEFSGITTSENNYLNSNIESTTKLNAFKRPEYSDVVIDDISPEQSGNINNNIISFEITSDKRLKYKYVNNNGNLIENESPNQINRIGWTIIDIVYKPYDIIEKYDISSYKCYLRRKGDLTFYVNGRKFWKINDFDEFYFIGLKNDKEKQIGVPYNITWGGGSFGLKHSWHYDINEYVLYNSGDTEYINTNFVVENNPIPNDCEIDLSNIALSGLLLSADTSTFRIGDICDSSIEYPMTVMRVEYTGGTSALTYFIKCNTPITVLSNRDYEVELSLFNDRFFKTVDENGNRIQNKISLLTYGTSDISVIDEIDYEIPLLFNNNSTPTNQQLYPFPDRQEYQYIRNGVMYYGVSGVKVTDEMDYVYGYDKYSNPPSLQETSFNSIVTGENSWKPIKLKFRTTENSGKNLIYIGILIETTNVFNLNRPLFITNFTYKGADIIKQDERKDNLFVEKYFNSSYIGNIQKLRVYNIALNPDEVLHNAIIETRNNSAYNLQISKGGRIISSNQNYPQLPQWTSGSDIRKSIRYRNADGTYRDLYQMIDIKVVVKSRVNPTVELVKFKKNIESGWLQLIWINDTTYDFIIPDEITSQHPNEILFAEILFQWADPLDIDNVFDKIFITNITTNSLQDNSVKNY
jgi:hypothetical protein